MKIKTRTELKKKNPNYWNECAELVSSKRNVVIRKVKWTFTVNDRVIILFIIMLWVVDLKRCALAVFPRPMNVNFLGKGFFFISYWANGEDHHHRFLWPQRGSSSLTRDMTEREREQFTVRRKKWCCCRGRSGNVGTWDNKSQKSPKSVKGKINNGSESVQQNHNTAKAPFQKTDFTWC